MLDAVAQVARCGRGGVGCGVAAFAAVCAVVALLAAIDVPARPSVPSSAAELAAAVARSQAAWRPAPASRVPSSPHELFLSRVKARRAPSWHRASPRCHAFRQLRRDLQVSFCANLVKQSVVPVRPQAQAAEIWRARAKSLAVRPPAEWVLRVSVTLFHEMATSGWWLALSAR